MFSFQVKIVGDFCNLCCSYCRNRESGKREVFTVMKSEILEKLFNVMVANNQKKIQVCWHGGEPLLAGIDFFDRIIQLEKKFPEKVWINNVQTNATLISEEWAIFFAKNKFNIGVSIDGCQIAHDMERINAGGVGSYKKAIDGVKILRSKNINPGIICTITKRTTPFAKQSLISLIENNFTGIAFNAFYNTIDTKFDQFGVDDESWFHFLKDIFDLWIKLENPSIRIREIDQILAWLEGRVSNSCVFKGGCSKWLVINWNGFIYPCERLGRSSCFGNVKNINCFDDILSIETFNNWVYKNNILPKSCQSCDIFKFCRNGCVSHRIMDEIDNQHFIYCNSLRRFYKYIKDCLGILS